MKCIYKNNLRVNTVVEMPDMEQDKNIDDMKDNGNMGACPVSFIFGKDGQVINYIHLVSY